MSSQREKAADNLRKYAADGLPKVLPYKLEQILPEIGGVEIMNVVVTRAQLNHSSLFLNKNSNYDSFQSIRHDLADISKEWNKIENIIDNKLVAILSELDDINDKIIRLSRMANVDADAPINMDDLSVVRVLFVKSCSKDMLMIGLLSLNTTAIIYVCACLNKRANTNNSMYCTK